MSDEFSVVILAGGRATRLPGKLQETLGGRTLLARVVHNLSRANAETVLAVDVGFDRATAAAFDVRLVTDETPGRGPVAALATAFATLSTPFVFVAPGDAPFVDDAFAQTLAIARRDGDEAVVPFEGEPPMGRLHPMPALYDRVAFTRAANKTLATAKPSLHAVLASLCVRRVAFPLGDRRLINVNTPGDLLEAERAIG